MNMDLNKVDNLQYDFMPISFPRIRRVFKFDRTNLNNRKKGCMEYSILINNPFKIALKSSECFIFGIDFSMPPV